MGKSVVITKNGDNKAVRVAVLDLYDNEPNQGMRCIRELIEGCSGFYQNTPVEYDVYETRFKGELPDTDYDVYISTGGPGSPFDGEDKLWEQRYFRLIDKLWNHNQNTDLARKYIFFICHSFQMMTRFFKFAEVRKRNRTSFGILPFNKTEAGKTDALFGQLPDQFYAADFRQFEVVQPKQKCLSDLGATVLSQESFRQDPAQEKALMAVRMSREIIGTQFHPEADPRSMLHHFSEPERKEQVVAEYGETAYTQMIERLRDPENIILTREAILPSFMLSAIKDLRAN